MMPWAALFLIILITLLFFSIMQSVLLLVTPGASRELFCTSFAVQISICLQGSSKQLLNQFALSNKMQHT